jgi:hypothetical protein
MIADVDSSCDTSIGTIEVITRSQTDDGLVVCQISVDIVAVRLRVEALETATEISCWLPWY